MNRNTKLPRPIKYRRESRSEYTANLELVKSKNDEKNDLNETLVAIARCHNLKIR